MCSVGPAAEPHPAELCPDCCEQQQRLRRRIQHEGAWIADAGKIAPKLYSSAMRQRSQTARRHRAKLYMRRRQASRHWRSLRAAALARLVLPSASAPQLSSINLTGCTALQYVFVQSASMLTLSLQGCSTLRKVTRLLPASAVSASAVCSVHQCTCCLT